MGFVAKSADSFAGGMHAAVYSWFVAAWLCIGSLVN